MTGEMYPITFHREDGTSFEQEVPIEQIQRWVKAVNDAGYYSEK